MGRVVLFISTIASVFILNWVFIRLAAPVNCINSIFVEKIDIIDGEHGTTLENCSLYVRLFGPLVREGSEPEKLIARLKKFEKAAFVWQQPEARVRVQVVPQNVLTLQDRLLVIGRDYLATDDFELALLGMLGPHRDPVTREAVARLYWSLFKPQNTKLYPWASYLRTLDGYCAEGHLLVHREFCKLQAELGEGLISDVDEGSIVWSLMPLLADTLRFAFQQLHPSERAPFLERSFLLGTYEDESLFSANLKGIQDLEKQYFQLLHLWLMPLLPDEKLLKKVEGASSLFASSYIYVVNETGEPLILPWGHSRHAIVESGARKSFSPSDVGLNLTRQDLFTHLKIDEVIVVGCQMPAPKRLLEFSPWVKTVYFIQKCRETDVNWAGLSDQGALKFAVSRNETKVFEFNLRSLRIAERWHGPLKGHTLNDWSRWLQWQDVVVDHDTTFMRPLSSIDAITRFRDPK